MLVVEDLQTDVSDVLFNSPGRSNSRHDSSSSPIFHLNARRVLKEHLQDVSPAQDNAKSLNTDKSRLIAGQLLCSALVFASWYRGIYTCYSNNFRRQRLATGVG
ncbi:hypothetical protein PISMIDRAFT_682535 [Pisolithus microcarpus 441]|uniref:Uncharacterized protein n=1 Tax=Pisolithus microcarpus 441 TaxID=765257 RepID=A0A0C9ZCI9_9AGAM|nr:hypothetical protein PISMIDRAFT_682535 [Pisolithus microcarpus 441]